MVYGPGFVWFSCRFFFVLDRPHTAVTHVLEVVYHNEVKTTPYRNRSYHSYIFTGSLFNDALSKSGYTAESTCKWDENYNFGVNSLMALKN